MASRYASRQGASASSSPAPPRRSIPLAQPASTASPQLLELRRQWKWAAVTQFLYTFAQLVALDDVYSVDIEEDLVNSTMIVIPRLMQRLLITLTQDRKISVDNWQSALRRQYLKRDPLANPIGVEPPTIRNSRAATVETEIKSEGRDSALPDDPAVVKIHEGEVSADEHIERDVSEKDSVETPQNEDERPASSPHDNNVKDEEGEVVENPQNAMKDWSSLSMLEKLESIHTVIEWHFQSPLRLRSVMRSDDETATWRIEPIGYDSKRNAYWFVGADRLWIQRVPPKPPKKATKRKAPSKPDGRKAKVARVDRADKSKKKKPKVPPETRDTPKHGSKAVETPKRTGRTSRGSPAMTDSLASSQVVSGRARAAKTQANVKLDLQAKQLAAAKAEMESLNRKATRKSPTKLSAQRTVGIRISRRLRGGADDDNDEWQPIPVEWLPASERVESRPAYKPAQATRTSARNKVAKIESKTMTPSGRTRISGLEIDEESDLTELSDSESSTHEETNLPEDPPSDLDGIPTRDGKEDTQDEVIPESQHPADFIEWETLCVSLQEWEEISHRFEKATHYLEKALHKVLAQEIVPFVTETLREAERLRIKEDALMNRKRSSRIAVREMEKETARLEILRRAEEEEKMARMRRLEARSRREEEERLKREQARDQRRKEREERELARARRLERATTEEVDVVAELRLNGAARAEEKATLSEIHKPSRRRPKKKTGDGSAETETWELDCEICGSKGTNKDDGIPLMSCGKCNKWQHIPCHDAIDRETGIPLRNWDAVDFFCKQCRAMQFEKPGTSQESSYYYDSWALNGQGRSDGRYSHGYGAVGLANAIKSGQINNMPSLHQQRAGPTSFASPSHYNPHQYGIPSGTSAAQYQFQPQLHSLANSSAVPQSIYTHGSPVSWNTGSQSHPVDSRRGNQSVLPHHTQNGLTNGHPTARFSYNTSMASSSAGAHPQNFQHSHQYLTHSEQRYNPAYQPQL